MFPATKFFFKFFYKNPVFQIVLDDRTGINHIILNFIVLIYHWPGLGMTAIAAVLSQQLPQVLLHGHPGHSIYRRNQVRYHRKIRDNSMSRFIEQV